VTDNVVDLFPESPEDAALLRRFGLMTVILQWSRQMSDEGRMPNEVRRAFHEYFSGEPFEDGEEDSGGEPR
jgi:hypothetical protein